MPTITSLAFDPAGVSLIAEIVEAALADAKAYGVPLPADESEARKLLGKRVILAVERGETHMGRLQELALLPTLP